MTVLEKLVKSQRAATHSKVDPTTARNCRKTDHLDDNLKEINICSKIVYGMYTVLKHYNEISPEEAEVLCALCESKRAG